jgi:serine/threonine protein kinase
MHLFYFAIPASLGSSGVARGFPADRDRVCCWRFAAGGLQTLDDAGKAIVVVGLVLGMKFIHLTGVIHRDLKPANILLDDRGHLTISDLRSSRFCDLELTVTSGVGSPLYIAPEMYGDADCTGAVGVYSFSLILYEVFVGEPAFPVTTTLTVLFGNVSLGDRPEPPELMDAAVSDIFRRGCSVEPGARGSFEGVFDALPQTGFKMTRAVDVGKLTEFAAQFDPSAAQKAAKQFPPSMKKRKNGWSVKYNVPNGIIGHDVRECGGDVHGRHVVDFAPGSFQKETEGANPHSGHMITKIGRLLGMLQIWKLVHVLIQLVTTVQKVFRTRGTIGCATISRGGGLCRRTTQSAQMVIVRVGTI